MKKLLLNFKRAAVNINGKGKPKIDAGIIMADSKTVEHRKRIDTGQIKR